MQVAHKCRYARVGVQSIGKGHDDNEHLVGSGDPSDVTCPFGVLSEKNRSGFQWTDFTVAGLDLTLTCEVDGKNSPRCRMPVSMPPGRHSLQDVAGGRLLFSEKNGRGRRHKVRRFKPDFQVLEVRLPVIIGPDPEYVRHLAKRTCPCGST